MALTMIEDNPGNATSGDNSQHLMNNNNPPSYETNQVHDLVAMIECQAYALEDIMKQKK